MNNTVVICFFLISIMLGFSRCQAREQRNQIEILQKEMVLQKKKLHKLKMETGLKIQQLKNNFILVNPLIIKHQSLIDRLKKECKKK